MSLEDIGDYTLPVDRKTAFLLVRKNRSIIASLMNGFNSNWKPRLEKIRVSFSYDS